MQFVLKSEVKVMVRVRRIICVPQHCILAVLLMGPIILITYNALCFSL